MPRSGSGIISAAFPWCISCKGGMGFQPMKNTGKDARATSVPLPRWSASIPLSLRCSTPGSLRRYTAPRCVPPEPSGHASGCACPCTGRRSGRSLHRPTELAGKSSVSGIPHVSESRVPCLSNPSSLCLFRLPCLFYPSGPSVIFLYGAGRACPMLRQRKSVATVGLC